MIVILTDVSGNVCGKVMLLDVLPIVKNVSSDISVRFPLCQHVQQCALSGTFLCPVALSDSSSSSLSLCVFFQPERERVKEVKEMKRTTRSKDRHDLSVLLLAEEREKQSQR